MTTRLLFATPDLFGPIGGIARISRATTLALHQWAEERGATLEVLALRDDARTSPDRRFLPDGGGRYRGFGGDRVALSARVASFGWGPGRRVTLFGHVNLAAAGLGQPLWALQALVAHGIEIWSAFPPLRLDRRLALARQDAIWPISRYTADRVLAAHRVREGRVTVVPNGLDPTFRPPAPEAMTPLSRRTPRLLTACSLARGFEYKGVDVTIKALARLPGSMRPTLDVVGDGEDRDRLEGLSRSLGLDGRVRFMGRLGDEELRELYASATAFVLPSTHEGFGLVFVEAMAFSLPVITVSAGAAPEVVEDGVTGLVVPPRDPAALAGAIGALVRDPGLAETLGRAGERRVRERYTFATYRQTLGAALDALLGR